MEEGQYTQHAIAALDAEICAIASRLETML
jgi:hypothetical protein